MIDGFIVVREERHIDDKHWVCHELDDALKIANDVCDYWKNQYEVGSGDGCVDETLYEGLLFHFSAEEAFRVHVEPVEIRAAGENEAADGN